MNQTTRLAKTFLLATIAGTILLCAPASSFAAFGFLGSFGTEGAADGQMDAPEGLGVGPNGHVYVGEASDERIDEFTSTGAFVRRWGKGVGGPGVNICTSGCVAASVGTGNGEFTSNSDLDVQPVNGDVYALDGDRVQQFSSTGTFIREWGDTGLAEGQFAGTYGGIDATADAVYVADSGNNRVQQFTLDGTFVRTWGRGVDNGTPAFQICTSGCQAGSSSGAAGAFSGAFDVGAAPSGDIYVVDGNRVQQFTSGLAFVRAWGKDVGGPGVHVCTATCVTAGSGSANGQMSSAAGVAFDAAGNVWISDSSNNRIQEFSAAGVFVAKYGSLGTGPDELDGMYSINFDCRGNLYVADLGNDRVQKLGEPAAGEPPCVASTPPASPSSPSPVSGQIQSLALGSKTFQVVNTGAAIFSKAKSKAAVGTVVNYVLSAAATTSFTVERATKGRKAGNKCKKQTRKNHKRKKCTLFKAVSGGFSHTGATGANSFKFSGRINNTALKPGSYRLVATAGAAVKRVEFKIVR